jgi:DNA topoisomerase-3
MLLETGKTSKIQGFTSKNGKKFDAFLKLQDGKIVFDF